MKIVIDIPEERYKDIQRIAEVQLDRLTDTVEQIVAKGTPIKQTDGDLISRQAVLDIFGDIHPLDYNARAYVAQIEELPSAEKPAEWISHEEDDLAINDYQCSKCNYWTEYNTKYCQNCGRRMKGAE